MLDAICPVYTGMNLSNEDNLILDSHLPRTHGDESEVKKRVKNRKKPTPYARG